MNIEDHISSDPDILFGKPVIKGTRIPVDLILEKLAAGETMDQLLKAYPRINAQTIQACLLYAAESIKGIIVYKAAWQIFGIDRYPNCRESDGKPV